jgi:hypothetical protein
MEGDDDRRLDAAVALGIITADQAKAIRDLVPARPAVAGPAPLGAATIGYVLGALTVLIAMGWFLADRWKWLGAGGVLAVAVLYGALFLVVSFRLRREGFPQAAGFAVLLAVGMVPVAVVAIYELVGWFARPSALACGYPDFTLWTCRGEELVVELTTLAALLVALRQVRFSLVVLPIAGIALRFLFHTADAVWRMGLGAASAGWVWVIGASMMTAAAYETSRRQQGDEDFALWLHLVAAVAAMIATTMLVGRFEEFRHLLIPGALVAFAFSLRLRRFVWTLLGMGWFVGYLGWLASEVFRDTPFFPIILAALGVGVLIATVWVQRNSAALVARFGGIAADGRPSFPGGAGLLLLPVVVALLNLSSAAELDRADRRASEARVRRVPAAETPAPAPPVRETPVRPRP